MPATPLSALHTAAGARLGPFEGWQVPLACAHPPGQPALVDRAWVGALAVEGPDARRFCNGMFTQNFRDLAVGKGARSALTDEKGRVLGLLHAWCEAPERFLLLLEGAEVAWFLERYSVYIVFDDVEIHELHQDHTVLTALGREEAVLLAALAQAGLPVPAAGSQVAAEGGLRVLGRRLHGLPAFDLVVPTVAAAATWEALRGAGLAPMGAEELEAVRIAAVDPRAPADLDRITFVHELGLVAECCSFAKGCYVGQEVVNRTETRGGVRKGLRLVHLDGPAPVGAEVLAGGDKAGRLGGTAFNGERWIGLAMLRHEHGEAGTPLHIQAEHGPVGARVVTAG